METSSLSQKVREIAEKAAKERGLEFVHSELAGTKRNAVVRIFVDKPGGVTIDDCGELSRAVEATLDEVDIIPSAYVLEVSSPGLERELYSIDDFKRFTGKKARMKTNVEVGGRRSFKGEIVSVEGNTIRFEDRAVGVFDIDHTSVTKANLVFDLADDLKQN